MANNENLKKAQGFNKHPENINRTGLNRGFKGLTATLKDVMESDGTMLIENIIELDENKKETGKVIRYGKVKIPKGEMIIIAAARKAMKGDMRAIEFITDRLDGKAIQRIHQLNEELLTAIEIIEIDADSTD